VTSFHEILFPVDIALKSAGGPQRRTDVVTLGSGAEERNARWAHSRRRYDAGYGVKTFEALSQVVAFFEERRGRLYGFRWRDRLDHSSAAPGVTVAPTDQIVGTGDGVTATFQLGKTYGALYSPYRRPIAKPVPGSIRVAVAETEADLGTQFTVDAATGVVTFRPGHIPPPDAAITAGFLFDVPVRFDTDRLPYGACDRSQRDRCDPSRAGAKVHSLLRHRDRPHHRDCTPPYHQPCAMMLGIILGALGNLLGGPFAKAALDAYRARLSAENASEKIAADLAARELAVEQRERELASQSVLAEQGRWYTSLPRPLFAFAFVIYVWKVVVWDKVFVFGSTDPLSGDVAHWATIVLTAYFGGRSIEKIARILTRK
jgi:uncharacterized protein (TIGR02217 family)